MRHRFLTAAVLAAALALTGCGAAGSLPGIKKEQKQFDAQYLNYFDTITAISICADDEAQFAEYKAAVEEDMKRYHQLFDIYHTYDGMTNVKTINDNAGTAPVTVDRDLFDMLKFAVKESEETDGYVNVAMGSVLSIWHNYREDGMEHPERAKVPTVEELKAADAFTDVRKVVLDEANLQVYLPEAEMSLDVGAVAKGYATHKIAERLREMGVKSALLSVGGNVETIGKKANGNPWRVGVQNPDTSSSKTYLYVVKLEDIALVTSGVYQRYYEVDGKRYHHIIQPETLFPGEDYGSVTILTKDGGHADAFSTAVFNMDLETGKAFVEAQEDVEAFWVLADGTEVFSSGFRKYIDK